MSGIAGIIRFDGGPVELSALEAMTASMAQRGPDGIRHWSSGSVALGHCMLVTTPEALEEELPLTNEDESLVLVMDGRVDNWEELRATLQSLGARLRTKADAELVLRAYETWGEDCLPRIDGDFAFVIWDARKRRAFCARDRVGAKPFIYHWDGSTFFFGSEVRAVLDAMDRPRKLNEGFLAETLAASWVSRDETLWQDVQRLVAARCITVNTRGCRIETYWHPDRLPVLRYRKDSEYVDHYQDVIFDVVRRLSRSHKVVGCDVSGGLDSSAIFSVADNLQRTGQLSAPEIKGYTLKFAEGSDGYELDFAHAVGAHLDREIKEVPPTLRPLSWYKDQAVRRAAVPNFPNGIMHFGTFEALREAGGRVFLNGLGGDQWLAFADSDYAESLQIGAFRSFVTSFQQDRLEFGNGAASYRLVRHGLYPLLPAPIRALVRRARGNAQRAPAGKDWLSPRLQCILGAQQKSKGVSNPLQSSPRIGLRERLLSLEGAYPAMGTEIMCDMASDVGVEYRSPFMNAAFVEMALALPLSMLRRGRTDRFVHRIAMIDLLPSVVLNRNTKADFTEVWEPLVGAFENMAFPKDPPGSDWLSSSYFSKVQSDLMVDDDGDLWPLGMFLCLVCCQEVNSDLSTGIEI